ncbi:putative disease resistance RPP13-like protein 1 [Carica papaya]|uniref:putative disease resistance RPP13-like protein 1 n=1 Tax=Carica papaya TaxID=3649 RepID=UPI000B8CD92B|nr:putative disease resistance RPP13-like protein 1 [Carica papaya]
MGFPTTSLVNESLVFGRDDDKQKVGTFLLPSSAADEKVIPVIAIVGVAGIGKTTLAQLLYNDKNVREHFDVLVWVYVSENFNIFKITRTILESVIRSHYSFTDLNSLQVELNEQLVGKKLLLVADDVWNEKFIDWDLLRRPLEAADPASRILVTTRNQGVARNMCAFHIHYLQPLSNESCQQVFAKHAFEDENAHFNRELHSLAKEIVGKCKGLPLVAKTLGCLLHSVVEVQEWKRILNSKIWDLPVDRSNILPSLRLSYFYLPAHLKQCFAYCSIFPKGYAFEKEKLVLLWMAQGFLQQPNDSGKTMEELGDEYFTELLIRSFFQAKGGSRFIMHDLVSDLSEFTAGEFCFKYEKDVLQKIPERARHFSYLRDNFDKPMKFEALYEVSSLRTFLPLSLSNSTQSSNLDNMTAENLLPTLNCLRVLSLSHYKITAIGPNFFRYLTKVRYLDLSYTEIRKLPPQICGLYNLQTLFLSHCYWLTELPADTPNLINLRYLDLDETKLREMPVGFGRLKSLQKLTSCVVSKDSGARISELGSLVNLHGKLSIFKLQNVENADEASSAHLENKIHLKEIVFEWDGESRDLQKEREILKSLQPNGGIEKMTIRRYHGREFPEWLGDSYLSKMTVLCLRECQNCTSLPSLGRLTALKELHVSDMMSLRKIGLEFYSTGSISPLNPPFKSLVTLWFENMPVWEDWEDHEVEGDGKWFPSLEELYLLRCPQLNGLPNCFSSFRSIHIHECPRLECSRDQPLEHQSLAHSSPIATLRDRPFMHV